MRVAVTGGAGYLGSRLADSFQARGHAVLSIDRVFDAETARERRVDLEDRQATVRVMREFGPDLVVHCGTYSALAYRDAFAPRFDADYRVLRHLLEALSALPSCRVVACSSSYVYSGLPADETVTERSPLRPQHPFGVAKAFFEQFLHRARANSVTVRLSSVFGPGTPRHPNTVSDMIDECLRMGYVTVWGKGRRRMQYVYLEDVLRVVEAVPQLPPGIYNLAGDEVATVREVAEMIAAQAGGRVVAVPDKPEGESLPRMSTDALRTHLRLPWTPLPAALSATVAARTTVRARLRR